MQLSAQVGSTADPSTIVTTVEGPSEGSVSAVGVGDGTAWLLTKHELLSVDPKDNQLVSVPIEEIKIKNYGRGFFLGRGMVAGGGSVWVFGTAHNVRGIHRIDPATGHCIAAIRLKKRKERVPDITYGMGALWVLNGSEGTLERIDPSTNQIAATIQVGKGDWNPVQVGDGSVWIMGWENGVVKRVDPRSNKVADEFSAGPPHHNGLLSEATKGGTYSFSVGQGVVWIFDDWNGRMLKNDMKPFEIATWGVDPKTHERIGSITRGVLWDTPMLWNGWAVKLVGPMRFQPAAATDHLISLPTIIQILGGTGDEEDVMAGDDALWYFYPGKWRFSHIRISRYQPRASGQSRAQQ